MLGAAYWGQPLFTPLHASLSVVIAPFNGLSLQQHKGLGSMKHVRDCAISHGLQSCLLLMHWGCRFIAETEAAEVIGKDAMRVIANGSADVIKPAAVQAAPQVPSGLGTKHSCRDGC